MNPPKAVLDASALLAWLFQERGHSTVQKLAGKCVLTTANMTEVLYRAAAEGYNKTLEDLYTNFITGGFGVIENTTEDAVMAAELIAASKKSGRHLSLGDGLCIAAAIRLDVPVVGGDQEWEILDLPIKVIPFR